MKAKFLKRFLYGERERERERQRETEREREELKLLLNNFYKYYFNKDFIMIL